jgi:uncharacterized damage-inducible protein DinB
MFRTIEDFRQAWAYESGATLRVLDALTDASLRQPVAPGGRTLERLAWHVVLTLREMLGTAGVSITGPEQADPVPAEAKAIAHHYRNSAKALGDAVAAHWTDAMLLETIPMYGERWTRGATLLSLITHQAHHRGQMTVLMRQAGLQVPGIYGPAREEWAAMGMAPHE